jgi:hypothetical protein
MSIAPLGTIHDKLLEEETMDAVIFEIENILMLVLLLPSLSETTIR